MFRISSLGFYLYKNKNLTTKISSKRLGEIIPPVCHWVNLLGAEVWAVLTALSRNAMCPEEFLLSTGTQSLFSMTSWNRWWMRTGMALGHVGLWSVSVAVTVVAISCVVSLWQGEASNLWPPPGCLYCSLPWCCLRCSAGRRKEAGNELYFPLKSN